MAETPKTNKFDFRNGFPIRDLYRLLQFKSKRLRSLFSPLLTKNIDRSNANASGR
jgi:hypothetical protein